MKTRVSHGTYTHGTPQIVKRTPVGFTYKRRDMFTPEDGEPVTEINAFATGPFDQSALWLGRRDEACQACYFHFPHTTDYHNRKAKLSD